MIEPVLICVSDSDCRHIHMLVLNQLRTAELCLAIASDAFLAMAETSSSASDRLTVARQALEEALNIEQRKFEAMKK